MKAIVNGHYREVSQLSGFTSNSQLQAWNLDDQRSLHASEILQAHDRKGRPNADFVREYPDEATRFFTQDQINEAVNRYE